MLYELFLLPLHSNEDGHQCHEKESTAEPPKKKYDNEENEDNESQKNVRKKDKE